MLFKRLCTLHISSIILIIMYNTFAMCRIPVPTKDDIQALKDLKTTPLSYLLNIDGTEESTPHGNVQKGSSLFYHVSSLLCILIFLY